MKRSTKQAYGERLSLQSTTMLLCKDCHMPRNMRILQHPVEVFFMAMLPQEHDEVQIHHQPTVWKMIGKFQAACQLGVLLVTGSDFRPMESEK